MRLLILGATGLVGSNALLQALDHSSISAVIAPTRKPLNPHRKLINPVSDRLLTLLPEVDSWKTDAVMCATGTTMRKAGSKEAFRQVDHDLPVAFAKAAHLSGAEVLALVSAMGASLDSLFFYSRIKAETERDIQQIGFHSLTIIRPGIIGGRRSEPRVVEALWIYLGTILRPLLPRVLRVNSASEIAAALVDAVVSQPLGCHFRPSSPFTSK